MSPVAIMWKVCGMPNVAQFCNVYGLQLLECQAESVIASAGMPTWSLISDGGWWYCQLGG